MFYTTFFITWIFVLLIWLCFQTWFIFFIKKFYKLQIFHGNLLFIAKGKTAEYYIKNEIKLEDGFFEIIIRIYNKYFLRTKLYAIAFTLCLAFYLILSIFFLGFTDYLVNILRELSYPYVLMIFIYLFCFCITLSGLLFYFKTIWYFTKLEKLSLKKVQEWQNLNTLYNDNKKISFDSFGNITNFKKPIRFFILSATESSLIFLQKFDPMNYDKEIFDNQEQYIYFLNILPYDDIKLNFKKIENNLIAELLK